jgi:hypothetical protein
MPGGPASRLASRSRPRGPAARAWARSPRALITPRPRQSAACAAALPAPAVAARVSQGPRGRGGPGSFRGRFRRACPPWSCPRQHARTHRPHHALAAPQPASRGPSTIAPPLRHPLSLLLSGFLYRSSPPPSSIAPLRRPLLPGSAMERRVRRPCPASPEGPAGGGGVVVDLGALPLAPLLPPAPAIARARARTRSQNLRATTPHLLSADTQH